MTAPPPLNEHSFSMAATKTAPPPTTTGSDAFKGTSKRERILRAAIDVFAKSGYFNAKVAEIAKAAGVAVAGSQTALSELFGALPMPPGLYAGLYAGFGFVG